MTSCAPSNWTRARSIPPTSARALAAEALAEIAEKGFRPDAAFLDIKMPGITGLELAKQVREQSPRTNVIFVTAYPERLLTGDRPEPAFLITKPFQPEAVKAAISQALFFDRRAGRKAA